MINKKFKVFIFLLITVLGFSLMGCTREFTVVFETNGGSAIEPVIVEKGVLISEPDEPEKDGFEFIGWYYDLELLVPYDFEAVVGEDLTLYAKWEEILYRLAIEDYYGNILYEHYFHEGDSLTAVELPEDQEVDGMMFLGWDLDIPAVMPDEDIVITPLFMEYMLIEIALITDTIGIGDDGINDESWDAVLAFAEANSLTAAYYTPLAYSYDNFVFVIELAIALGAKIVVCPGYVFEVAVYDLQSLHPDVAFLMLDGQPHDETYVDYEITDNTVSIIFPEEEAGFLAGYAAVMDGYRELGFIGAMEIPAVVQYGYGFIQGAEYAAYELGLDTGDVNIKYWYAGTFGEDETILNIAKSWYQNGTEIIFSVCGTGNQSVMIAAEEHLGKMIGVDLDQSMMSDVFITSAIKEFGNMIYFALELFYGNECVWPVDFGGNQFEFGAY